MADAYVEPSENPFAKPAPAPARATASVRDVRLETDSVAQVKDTTPVLRPSKSVSRVSDARDAVADDADAERGAPDVPPVRVPAVLPNERRDARGCCSVCAACCCSTHRYITASANLSSSFLLFLCLVAAALFAYSCALLQSRPWPDTCGVGCTPGCAVMLPLTSCDDPCITATLGSAIPFSFTTSAGRPHVVCAFPMYIANVRIVVAFFTAAIAVAVQSTILLVGSAVGFSYLLIVDSTVIERGRKACEARFSGTAAVSPSVFLTCSVTLFAAVAVLDFFLIPLSLYGAVIACARYRVLPADAAARKESRKNLPAAEEKPDFDRPEDRPEEISRPNFEGESAGAAPSRPAFE